MSVHEGNRGIGKLTEIGLTLHPNKTHIRSLKAVIKFLGFNYRLVNSGVVVKTVAPNNVKSERRKLRRMVNLAKKGELTRSKVDACYISWKAHASKGNSRDLIRKMDRFYNELWRTE